ncbi:hypothetical protein T484DRAFT_1815573, partial [Baffinella frigidus]
VDNNPLLALLPLELGVLPKLKEVAYDSATVSEPCTQFHGDLETLLWAMKTMHLSRSSNTLDLSARSLVSLPNEVRGSLRAISGARCAWLGTLLWVMKTMHLSRSSSSLDLSARSLVSLPNEVLKLTGLTALSLARNKITLLPDNMMDHLSSLRFLDLEQN